MKITEQQSKCSADFGSVLPGWRCFPAWQQTQRSGLIALFNTCCPSDINNVPIMTTLGYRIRGKPKPRTQTFLDKSDTNNNTQKPDFSLPDRKRLSKQGKWRMPKYGEYIMDPTVYTVEVDYRRSYGKIHSRDWEGYEAMLQRQLG